MEGVASLEESNPKLAHGGAFLHPFPGLLLNARSFPGHFQGALEGWGQTAHAKTKTQPLRTMHSNSLVFHGHCSCAWVGHGSHNSCQRANICLQLSPT